MKEKGVKEEKVCGKWGRRKEKEEGNKEDMGDEKEG